MLSPSPGMAQWVVAIAVRSLETVKSRMADQLSPQQRGDLVLAMAHDVVNAALACPQVTSCLVVTPDAVVAQVLKSAGADVVLEARAQGLNSAFTRACYAVRRQADGPLALLMADLPFLRSADLGAALTAVPSDRSAVVADGPGMGTTLLAARRASSLRPAFGPGSLAAHLGDAAVDLSPFVAPGLRHDVDDLASLDGPGLVGGCTARWRSRQERAVSA